jgi:ribose 5-phosphate isomerase
MKKLFENWNEFLNEAERIKIYSTSVKIALKKPEGASAVIDDTLALIRGIPSITVVNSVTDELASDINKAIIDVEFKFIPRSSALESDLKSIKREILAISSLVLSASSVRRMVTTLVRVQ